MEDMNSEFQMNGMNRLKELFAAISENSGYNLDRYISGQSLTVSGDNEGFDAAYERIFSGNPGSC